MGKIQGRGITLLDQTINCGESSPRMQVPLSATISESIETNVTFEGPTSLGRTGQGPIGFPRWGRFGEMNLQ